jgi:hypothetical protein
MNLSLLLINIMFLKRSLMVIKIFVLCFLFLSLVSFTKSQTVCSLDELIRELYEDLIDNGKLDCLRKSATPNEADETEEQKQRRVAAEWDSDCSFEADGTGAAAWLPKLLNNYQLKKGLVDVNGDPVEADFDDQADMCEIVRAFVANGKVPAIGEDVKSIDLKLLDYIDCPGGEGQTEVCAATASSFADKKSWIIFLEGSTITVNKEPKYILSAGK